MRNNMRTSFLAAFLGLSLVACTGVIGDPGPGGDDDDTVPGPNCGDAVVNAGETCDDGNNTSGDGCSAACSVEASPALSVVVDKTSVMTELMTETMLTLTLTSSGGFSGPVTLTGSALNAQNAPIQGWALTFDAPTVDIVADGMSTVVATLKIPSENMGLAGTVKVDASSSLGATSTETAVTVLDQISLPMSLTGGLCNYPAVKAFTMTTGSKIRWVNNSTDTIRIHIDGALQGDTKLDHEPAPGTPAGQVHEQTIGGVGLAGWYCHDRDNKNDGRLITTRAL